MPLPPKTNSLIRPLPPDKLSFQATPTRHTLLSDHSHRRQALLSGLVFGGSGQIRELVFGGSGLIRELVFVGSGQIRELVWWEWPDKRACPFIRLQPPKTSSLI
jgi:hypothetical protein